MQFMGYLELFVGTSEFFVILITLIDAVQLSEHQLGRSDHSMHNHMQDNSHLAMSGHHHYSSLDASGSGADHLPQQSTGHEHHVHNDNSEHESKSEHYGEFKLRQIID